MNLFLGYNWIWTKTADTVTSDFYSRIHVSQNSQKETENAQNKTSNLQVVSNYQ